MRVHSNAFQQLGLIETDEMKFCATGYAVLQIGYVWIKTGCAEHREACLYDDHGQHFDSAWEGRDCLGIRAELCISLVAAAGDRPRPR